MTKKLKIYQILTFALGLAFVGLCLYVGITALQKSMKLNLSFEVDPNFNVKVEYKLAQEDDYIFAFSNSSLDEKGVSLGNNVKLSGNTITLDDGFSGFGETIYIKVTNYTELPTEGDYNFIKLTSGENAVGVSSYSTSVNPYVENSDAPYVEFSVTITSEEGNVVVPINFAWASGYTVTFTSNTSDALNATISEELIAQGGSCEVVIKGNSEATDSRGISFAEYSSDKPQIQGDCTYTFDIKTGVLNLTNIQENISISANAKPWVYGSYVDSGDSEMEIGTEVSTNVIHYPAFKDYTFVKFAGAYNYYYYSDVKEPLRFIIIGAGENVNHFLATPWGYGDMTSYAFAGTLKNQNGEIIKDAGSNDVVGKNKGELTQNQVLLLSEYLNTSYMISAPSIDYANGNAYDNSWGKNGNNTKLNNLDSFLYDSSNSLGVYVDKYIVKPSIPLRSTCADDSLVKENGYSKRVVHLTESDNSYGFILATLYGNVGSGLASSGMSSRTDGYINGEKVSSDNEAYYSQNFAIEDYLGTCDSNYGGDYIVGLENSPKMFSFNSLTYSKCGLRTGSDSYIMDATMFLVQSNGSMIYDTAGGVAGRPAFILDMGYVEA